MRMNTVFGSVLAVAILFISSAARASEMKMIFWYPGEAGSTVEAQPILDAFTDYLSGKIAGGSIKGTYFNTLPDGFSFINKQKPGVGIVSFAAWSGNSSKFSNARVWLATNPLPNGQKEENYLLVGRSQKIDPGAQLFSSEPLTPDFIEKRLLFTQVGGLKPAQTSQILLKLRLISEGSISAIAILTPAEGATLSKMTAPWARSLTTIAISAAVPTARVVLFDPQLKEASRMKEILLGMRNDPLAKAILEDMRLAGFSEP